MTTLDENEQSLSRCAPAHSTHAEARFAAFLTTIYVLVEAALLARHEMWADELQAWAIACRSDSIVALLQNAAYEGHPPLWHLCLWVVSRFTHAPEAMQVLHLLIASAAVWIVARWAPFSRLQKVGLCFSYFLLYEYATISREYSLTDLFLFGFCALVGGGAPAWLLFLLLGVLANTSVYATIMASALAAFLLWQRLFERSPQVSTEEKAAGSKKLQVSSVMAGLALFMFLAGAAAWQIAAARLAHHSPSAVPGLENPKFLAYHRTLGYFLTRLAIMIFPVWQAYLPMENQQQYLWNSNLFAGALSGLMPLWVVLTLLLSILFAVAMRRASLAIAFLTGTATMIIVGFPAARHEGMAFIFLFACWWLSKLFPAPESAGAALRERFAAIALSAILVVQVVAAAIMAGTDLVKPFSTGRYAAEYIVAHNVQNLPVFGTPDWIVAPIGAWLDRDVWMCESMRCGNFVLWDGKTVYPNSDDEVYARLDELMRRNGFNACLFVKRAEKPFESARFLSRKLVSFDDAMIENERYAVYEVELAPVKTRSK
ncbi:MAG TPA: hypothetical protein V6C81_21020 [Planktothrix sp.]